ncbi:ATP-grasp domain-containing protein, partial [Coprococcus catus]|uniref:ATP-grasp domain-containing protein n=3 Tax=Bacillota TaxID=1239 RepID=UPI001D07EEDF
DLEYPLVIKPDSGYGSSGVYLLKNELELETNMKKVAKAIKIMKLWSNGYNFNSEIVLEEYIEGKEYAIDMLWFKGEIVFSGICE